MVSKKKRVEIPPSLAAEVQFYSDRACCVCRIKGKPFQIHHIDENPSNNVFKNLAVLCFDCHNETQIHGGFHRKLDAEQITRNYSGTLTKPLYRRAQFLESIKMYCNDLPVSPLVKRFDRFYGT